MKNWSHHEIAKETNTHSTQYIALDKTKRPQTMFSLEQYQAFQHNEPIEACLVILQRITLWFFHDCKKATNWKDCL